MVGGPQEDDEGVVVENWRDVDSESGCVSSAGMNPLMHERALICGLLMQPYSNRPQMRKDFEIFFDCRPPPLEAD